MGKVRVYELAKELNLESKKIIDFLSQKGVAVKNHMSVLEESQVDLVRSGLAGAPSVEGFKPKIKRIPKAVVEAEAAAREAAAEKAEAETKKETTEEPAATATAEKTVPESKPAVEKPAPSVAADVSAQAPVQAEPKPEKVETPAVSEQQEVAAAEKPAPEVVKAPEKPAPKASTVPPVEKPKTEEKKAPQPAPTANKTGNKWNENNKKPAAQAGNPNRRNDRNDGQRSNQNRNYNQGGNNRSNNYQGQKNNQGRYQDKAGQGGRPNGGGYQGKPGGNNRPNQNRGGAVASAGEMRYTPAAPAKPVSRRVDKKKENSKDRSFYNDKYNKDFVPNKSNRNRPKNKYKEAKKQQMVMPPVTPKKVVIGETIILQELAKSMSKTASELIKKLFEMGIMATINQELDADTAILLADEFGVTVEVKQEKIDEILEDDDDNPRDLKERPPVVTVMGHVDHGKTSLLDAIRKTSVTATEAGGITQHIGAYQVDVQGKKITFLDTPGHEAFTSMRARGAQITDISVIVVAADDGVMPQTVEAINHSKAAEVPIIIAINKIDKPGANPERVKQELMEHGLVSEEWGGDVIMVPVSAKKGEGLENLLEMILLVAEVSELKANPKRQARGTVIEAKLDKSRGPVATLLVQKGTLKIGETIIAGSAFGKVRAMVDDKNRKVKSAGPSMPVEILGFSEVPPPGEIFIAIKDEKDARYAAQIQAIKKREEEMRKSSKVSLDDLFKHISEGDVKELNIVIKADVQGSAEAVRQSLENLSNSEVKVKVIHVGVGAINESDVTLADASNAIIIGFNVRPNAQTRKAVETSGVDMRLYRVIYDAIEDVKKAMVGLLEPEFKETLLGHVEVRNTFRVPKVGMIAGGYVVDGKITRQSEARVVRDGIVVWEGKLASLKRFKDDVKEVLSGFECGIGLEDFNDIKEGDTIEAFIMEETERQLKED